jgi:hypothetical protein
MYMKRLCFTGFLMFSLMASYPVFSQVCPQGTMIYFESASTTLNSTEKHKLDSLSALLKKGNTYI